MSGVKVIRYLLANDTNSPSLNDTVAARNIMAGDVPIDRGLPSISITQVSSVPRLSLDPNKRPRLHTDRVQVTVMTKATNETPAGAGYSGLRSILALVLDACPHQRGVINGVTVDSILPEAEGPDFQDDAPTFHTGSRDFIVKWLELA